MIVDFTNPNEFREIPYLPGYGVSVDGRVWSCKNTRGKSNKPWRALKARPDGQGYLQVNPSVDGVAKNCKNHRLVLEMFVGPCPKGMEGRHLDDNKNNNHLSNLAWGTHTENEQDKRRNGYCNKGENHGYSKLTDEKVRRIVHLLQEGNHTREVIAKMFGVSRSTIRFIAYGETWTHITGGPIQFPKTSFAGDKNPRRELTEEKVRQMRNLHKQGVSSGRLAKQFGVSKVTASRIVNRRSWTHIA